MQFDSFALTPEFIYCINSFAEGSNSFSVYLGSPDAVDLMLLFPE